MADQLDAAASSQAFRRRLAALGAPAGATLPAAPSALPAALPVAGALSGTDPLDVEGGLAISSWFFRRRLAAFGAGADMAVYRLPFDPA